MQTDILTCPQVLVLLLGLILEAACAGTASSTNFVSHPAFKRALGAVHRHVLPGEEREDEATLQETSIPRGGMLSPHLGLSRCTAANVDALEVMAQPDGSHWPKLEIYPDDEIALFDGI